MTLTDAGRDAVLAAATRGERVLVVVPDRVTSAVTYGRLNTANGGHVLANAHGAVMVIAVADLPRLRGTTLHLAYLSLGVPATPAVLEHLSPLLAAVGGQVVEEAFAIDTIPGAPA